MIVATTTPNALTSATMTQQSNISNTATTYTFTFSNTNIIPVGAKIEIIAPIGCLLSSTISCASVSGFDPTMTCAKDPLNTLGIIISNGFNT
jgi:hypothetical protein